MKSKTIVFTEPGKAELLEKEPREMTCDRVKVRMEYTVVSGDLSGALRE